MAQPSQTVIRKMAACAKAVDGSSVRSILTDVGVAAKKIVEGEVAKDFGADLGMSGWRRGRVIKLRSGFQQPADDRLVVVPRPGGPMIVAEQGRRAGTGPGRRKRGRSRRSPSSWGATRGKRTWTRSRRAIERDGSRLYRKAQTRRVFDAFKS